MKINTPGDFVAGLKNGRIYCSDVSHIATISEGGYVVEELSFQWGDERIDPAKENRVFKVRGFVKPKIYKGKVFSLLSGGGAKYFLYHWMLETIPKMYLFQQSGELDKDSRFIIPNQHFRYQKEFLKHFGIDEQHIIDEEQVHHIQADWLYVTSHVKYFDHHPAWSCNFLYKSIVQRQEKAPSRRIYISRGDAAKNRPVVNEPQLIEVLGRHGFESVQLSRLSIYEKAQVFNSASIIVGVHGGGLANLVYCESGTKVLEIFPDGYVRHAYYDIADKRLLRYSYLLLPTIGEAVDALQGQKLGLVIDVEKVESKILSMLEDKGMLA
ncbi:MAG TPA: glycosyltransferase family 61 protein [Chryseolinea sp.]|nr:glycosyltransferase family 61 protein [Chryseolinea sp.]